jgi:hypothetical protein
MSLWSGFLQVLSEVVLALLPLVGLFIVFELFIIKLEKEKLKQLLGGVVIAAIGLGIFLQGVYRGILPTGEKVGFALGQIKGWILLPVGFLLGFVITLAEPGVHTLNYEVEHGSSGAIPGKLMLLTISIGVATAVGASLLRVAYGIPLGYFLYPGYLLAFLMVRHAAPPFSAVAFDAAGVATGPMIVTFVSAITLGLAKAQGRDPLREGFGMVALVALASILAVLVLGVLYKRQLRKMGGEEDGL